MPYHRITLKRGQALVLHGPQGCGKTTTARAIAQRYGRYREITSAELASPFCLGAALASEPKTLICEVEQPLTLRDLETIRSLITSETVSAEVKGQLPVNVRSPNLIFCTGDANCIRPTRQRFRFVRLGKQ